MTILDDSKRCSRNNIPDPGSRGFHFHRCRKRGVVERDGKLYCKVHDPVAVAEKHAAEARKWRRVDEIRRLEWDIVANARAGDGSQAVALGRKLNEFYKGVDND